MIELRPHDETFFRVEISKDEQPPVHYLNGGLIKTTTSPLTAAAEYSALNRLAGRRLAPVPLGVNGCQVIIDEARGIRVHELLVHAARHPHLHTVATAFLDRLAARLTTIQTELRYPTWPTQAYPFDSKVTATIAFLSRLLCLPTNAAHDVELARMEVEWLAMARVPFRDAVVKNMILVDHALAPGFASSWSERAEAIENALSTQGEELFARELQDIDFSSVVHLTTFADDWVSLQLHESCAPFMKGRALQFPPRCSKREIALSILVRFIRFGGRKMAYALLAPTSAAERFEHDSAAYYFDHLTGAVESADPTFWAEYPATGERIRLLAQRFAAVTMPDHDLVPTRYPSWKESPLGPPGR